MNPGLIDEQIGNGGVVLPGPSSGGSEPTDNTFDPGGDNEQFFNESITDVNALIENVAEQIFRELVIAGNGFGYSPLSMQQFFAGNWTNDGALGLIDQILQEAEHAREAHLRDQSEFNVGAGTPREELGSQFYVRTIEGFNELTRRVWDWFNQKAPVDLGAFGSNTISSGGSRRGSSGPSAEDIRGQFDIEELAEAAKNIWRGLLLDDDLDARGFARSYVDAIVAGKGKKKIDFTEFIRGKAKATSRYASIYKNKPESLSEEQYLAPYFQSAQQVAAPGRAAEIAIGGAQFGADAATFAARLRRDEAATGSAPFIEELQGRLTDLNRLFRAS